MAYPKKSSIVCDSAAEAELDAINIGDKLGLLMKIKIEAIIRQTDRQYVDSFILFRATTSIKNIMAITNCRVWDLGLLEIIYKEQAKTSNLENNLVRHISY